MAISHLSTADVPGLGPESEPARGAVIERVNAILGYDVFETAIIRSDKELYARVTTRMATTGQLIAAEDVLGDLDKE